MKYILFAMHLFLVPESDCDPVCFPSHAVRPRYILSQDGAVLLRAVLFAVRQRYAKEELEKTSLHGGVLYYMSCCR